MQPYRCVEKNETNLYSYNFECLYLLFSLTRFFFVDKKPKFVDKWFEVDEFCQL